MIQYFFVISCRIGAVLEIGDKSPKKKESNKSAAEKLWNRREELLKLKGSLVMDVDEVGK